MVTRARIERTCSADHSVRRRVGVFVLVMSEAMSARVIFFFRSLTIRCAFITSRVC